MKCALSLVGLLFLVFPTCHTANIVAYMPLPFYSHQTAFKPLWLELAKRGHKITLIQSNVIVENNENITHIVLNETHAMMNPFLDQLGEGQSIIRVLISGLETMSKLMEYHMKHPQVQELLKGEKKVDLYFTEFLAPIGFSLGRKLNTSMIGLVSMDGTTYGHLFLGNPTHPVMYPDKELPFSPPLSFIERVISTFFYIAFEVTMNFLFKPVQQRIVDECLGEDAPLDEIVKNVSLLFINANPLFNGVRPLGPKTINIGGGVHLLEPRPLPKDLQEYLDNAKNGVIYFSLGSSIVSKQLHETTKKVILETFSQLPYAVLWKLDEDIVEKSDNVKIMNWIPQQDLLRHKNIKLFITQGGLQSMEEAIFSYVPMIALPFYGDQHNNAHKMANRGFGLTLDHTTLDVGTFKSAILEVVNNPKYRERTKESADLVMDQPMTGLEKGVWWTEYVLRHGQTNHFRNPSVDTPWYQFLLLDVILFFLVTTVVVIYILFKTVQLLKLLVWKLINRLRNKPKTKTS